MHLQNIFLALQIVSASVYAATVPVPATLQQPSESQTDSAGCSPKGPTLCSVSRVCHVAGTTVTLHLHGTGHRIHPNDMREILERAQQDIDNKFFEKERQDRMLAPDEIPWTVQYNSLILRAQQGGWSWKLLNYTIIGVRECAYKKGIFEEIFVNSVQDPRALDPSGGRFLNIVERSRPSPPPANGVVAPRPLPPGLRRCEDFTTEIRLLFEFADAVDAYAMQEIYDQAQKALLNIIQTQGDRVLVGGDLPWTFQGNGLLLKAQFEGWSFGALNRTIGAMRKCTFQPGTFREVLVYDIAGENLPPGQRYMDLRKSQRLS